MKPRKGMILSVLRDTQLGVDCTLGGLSATHNEILLVGPKVAEVFSERPGLPVFYIRERGGRLNAYPADVESEPGLSGWMFGGNFLHTSDSRFDEIGTYGYPLPIHDRRERP